MLGTDNIIFRIIYYWLTDKSFFENKSSKNIKVSKVRLSKIIQVMGFLGRLLEPLTKVSLPLMKNVLISLSKGVLVPLRLASTADAGIHKKILELSRGIFRGG